ncbi:MAG: PDZ domain-containing protein [Armatimonadetes bacterium]|nr:PDZ domain-containing protein [Armatimonadota bacterium]
MLAPLLWLHIATQPTDFNAPKTWETVSKRIKTMYWARNKVADKLSRLLAEAEPRATAAKDPNEFDAAMDDMIAKFGDSHFDFLTKDEQGFYLFDALSKGDKAVKMPNIGAWFKKTKDGYTVQMVLEDGPAAKAGLRKGDVVTTIDGRPFAPVAPLAASIGKTVRLEWMHPRSDGSLQQATGSADVAETQGLQMFLDASRRSGRIIEKDGKKFGYFHLWTMASSAFKDALEGFVYGKAKDTDAFILDVRDGFGGRPEGYGDPFFRPEVKLDWTIGAGGSQKQLFGYQKPLIVIINPGSRSAKEVFSYIMKKSKRAVLVGNHTAGDVLGTSPSPVEDWAYVEIPMVDVAVDGIRLEKNPVQADVQVAREYDDNGNDLYLEKAIETALGKVRR